MTTPAPEGAAPRIHPEPVFGASWADKRPPGLAALIASAKQRHPCPICGHPTSDCTGDQAHG